VFYESHWNKVSTKLARGVAGDIAAIIDLLSQNNSPQGREAVIELASIRFGLEAQILDGEVLKNIKKDPTKSIFGKATFLKSMNEVISNPFNIDRHKIDKHVVITIQLPQGVLKVVTNRKRIFSSTTYIFVIWMAGTAMILFGVATTFMRNQVRPIKRLAAAADDFGKGRDTPGFKPEGASEVRQAAAAFISMRDRIQRQISQRTDMLSGVSHDLRTPLTRMKLELEVRFDPEMVKELKTDILDMEKMLDAYLSFARGEGEELAKEIDLSVFLLDIINSVKRNGINIEHHVEDNIIITLKPDAFKRCLINLIENADRYADLVSISSGISDQFVEILIDDDGKGIPENERENVFKPFYRLENSRNPETGGVGLGLSIARDIVRAHGGEIVLEEAHLSGLRVRVSLPL
jgi:two-component system osmolarity sensor histidine kinase EnvZ